MWRLITLHLRKSYKLTVKIKAFFIKCTLLIYYINLYVLLLAFLNYQVITF